MGGIIATSIIAFLTMFIPGALLALALLYRKTDLHIIEILIIGFIFGLIAPATLTWAESYLVSSVHAFSFSLALFEENALALTIVGAILCFQQGVFKEVRFPGMTRPQVIRTEQAEIKEMAKDYKESLSRTRSSLAYFDEASEIIAKHKEEEDDLQRRHHDEQRLIGQLGEADRAKLAELHKQEEAKLIAQHESEESILLDRLRKKSEQPGKPIINLKTSWVWILLLAIMLMTFATRMFGIGPSSQFFEFDPYFDMMAAQSILVYGQQFYQMPSAWPTEVNGSVMRVQPLVPYFEAYWYDLANSLGPHHKTFSTTLMSYVSGVYPPITAALLAFSIFVLLYHEYGKYVGLIGAALAATMPVLFTTFVAGEQLLEPWGIFTLFFFFATYMFAVRNMKSVRLAILAGVAFASTFLGAHYYTVDTGVLAAYIILQGGISVLRREISRDFYKMNIIVIAVIAIFLVAYEPYGAVVGSGVPTLLGLPLTLVLPVGALAIIAIYDYIPKILKNMNILFKRLDWKEYLGWLFILVILLFAVIFGVPQLRKPIVGYLNLSKKFTTPSTPLFMTVQEYIPTGLTYNFGAQGFGVVGASLGGLPVLVWLITVIAVVMIVISIIYRRSRTGIFYMAIALPLMVAGYSEVKYLPHFGTAFILLFCIIIGETLLIADHDFDLKKYGKALSQHLVEKPDYAAAFERHSALVFGILAIGIFFVSSLLAMVFLIAVIFFKMAKQSGAYLWGLLLLFIIITGASIFVNHQIMFGESRTMVDAFAAAYTHSASGATACATISNHGNSIGADIFCNLVPSYWTAAMSWMRQNIGPFGARVLSWWDYGDWINWFGNTNAVLRGDNSQPTADYAAAATFVLGSQDGYPPQSLANYMGTNQTEYVLFDQDLVAKWQALDFLGCVHVNETSRAFAIEQGQAQSPPVPYALGNSQCELSHDPQFALVPLAALIPNTTSLTQSIAYYCSSSNATTPLIKSYLVKGNSLSNQTVCVSSVPNSNGVLNVYSSSGTRINAVVQSAFYEGVVDVSSIPFVEYLMIYLPNSPNDTITNAPSAFYDSNYYRGFFLGSLPGFHEVYPSNAIGINFVNGTYPVRIFALNNFTGTLPHIPPKPSWVHNNYTMP